MQIKININVENKFEIYKSYLSIINWTLGDKSLSNKEIDILAHFMYYNELYANIPEEEAKIELLMSASTKKKIKQKLSMSSSMFDTYLSRIKKKGLISDTGIQGTLNKIRLSNEYIISFAVKQVEKKVEEIVEKIKTVEQKTTEETIIDKTDELTEQPAEVHIPANISGYAELEKYRKMLEEDDDDNLEYEDI
jgi:hypothetical protein